MSSLWEEFLQYSVFSVEECVSIPIAVRNKLCKYVSDLSEESNLLIDLLNSTRSNYREMVTKLESNLPHYHQSLLMKVAIDCKNLAFLKEDQFLARQEYMAQQLKTMQKHVEETEKVMSHERALMTKEMEILKRREQTSWDGEDPSKELVEHDAEMMNYVEENVVLKKMVDDLKTMLVGTRKMEAVARRAEGSSTGSSVSETSDVVSTHHALHPLPPGQSDATSESPFSCLSDEMMLRVFAFLPKSVIGRCACTCRNWRRITSDASLWKRLDLGSARLRPGIVAQALARGTVHLSAQQAIFQEPVFRGGFPSDESYRLQYLNLTWAKISHDGLSTLLSRCRNLRKLSLAECQVDVATCEAVGALRQLEVLDMWGCRTLSEVGIAIISAGCCKLLEWNLFLTHLSAKSISILCSLVHCGLRRLDLAYMDHLRDQHLATLVKRCPGLVELGLFHCDGLSPACIDYLVSLQRLECLTMSVNEVMNPTVLQRLSVLSPRCSLNLPSSNAASRAALHGLHIAEKWGSTIAQPLVDARGRMWGVKVDKFY